MDDPYIILGVDQDATQADIKNAYRDKARECHPDRGGDTDEFSKVSEAHAILIDPTKRRMYDEGCRDFSPDREESQAIQNLCAMFHDIIESAGENIVMVDVISTMRRGSVKTMNNIDRKIASMRGKIRQLEMIKKRIRKKDGENDFLSISVLDKIRDINRDIERAESDKRVGEIMVEYLDNYEFDFDKLNDMEGSTCAKSGSPFWQ